MKGTLRFERFTGNPGSPGVPVLDLRLTASAKNVGNCGKQRSSRKSVSTRALMPVLIAKTLTGSAFAARAMCGSKRREIGLARVFTEFRCALTEKVCVRIITVSLYILSVSTVMERTR